MANISYIRILQAIELFSKEHLQVKRFASDFPAQLPNFGTETEKYPILFVSPNNSIFNENVTQFTLNIYCMDIIQKDRENINTILSDTNLILSDLHRWILDGDVYGIDIIGTPQTTPIDNALLDYCAGWVMTLTLEASTYGVCEIPFSNEPVILMEINDVLYSSYLTCDTLNDCDTFTNAIDNLQEQIDNLPGEQDLQSVLDVGNTATDKDIVLNDSSGDNTATYTYVGFYTNDVGNNQQNSIDYKSWYQLKGDGKGWTFDTNRGIEFTFNENNIPTKITNVNSKESITLNVPDKPEGEYTIATTDDIVVNPTLDEVLGNGNTTDKTAIFSDGTKTSTISHLSVFVGDINTDGTTINNNRITFRKWGGGSSADIVQELTLNTSQSNSYTPIYQLPAKNQDQYYTLVTNDELNLNNIVMNGGNNTINAAIVNAIGTSGQGYSSWSPGSLSISNLGADYINITPGAIIFKQVTGNTVRLISSTMTASNVIYRLPVKSTAGTYDLVTSETLTDGYVPYVGATKTINTGTQSIVTNNLQIATQSTYTPAVGNIGWNDTDGTLEFKLKGGNVTLQIGQENVARIVNKTGADLLESQFKVVRIRSVSEGGAQGQRLAVKLAQADNDLDSATTLGVVTENISNNQEGFITTYGQVKSINTTGAMSYGGTETWVDGDMLYLSPSYPGYMTNVKPVAPQHMVVIGYVEYSHANNGKIFVKIDNGYELDELHNVKITGTPSNNSLLVYGTASNIWENKTLEQITGEFNFIMNEPVSYTGSAAEVEMLRLELPPYTFAANDMLKIPTLLVQKTGTVNSYTIRIKMSTSPTMPATTTDLIAAYSPSATITNTNMVRTWFLSGGVLRGLGISNTVTDTIASTTQINVAFDHTITNYLYISIDSAGGQDTQTLVGFQLTNR